MAKFQLPQFTLAQVLGIGLGFTFLYAGIASLIDPTPWIGYLPAWMTAIVPAGTLVTIHGIFHTLLGLALAVNFSLKATSLLAILDLSAIILFYGIDLVTFRDVGLLIMAVVLFRVAMGDLARK